MPRANYEPAKASRNAIAAYWSKHLRASTDASGGDSYDLDPDRCWACNHDGSGRYPLHRCHLVAAGHGRVQNLVILCQRCHAWQEKRDPDDVLLWISWCQSEQALMYPAWADSMAPGAELRKFLAQLDLYMKTLEDKGLTIAAMHSCFIPETIWSIRDDWHGWDDE